jgi:hypothetical protein
MGKDTSRRVSSLRTQFAIASRCLATPSTAGRPHPLRPRSAAMGGGVDHTEGPGAKQDENEDGGGRQDVTEGGHGR